MTLKQLYADVSALLEAHGANAHTKAEVDRIFSLAEAAASAMAPSDATDATTTDEPSVVNDPPDDGGTP